jgi:hypothetical protein
MVDYRVFDSKAPGIIAKLRGDFPFALDDSAAVVGNLGHECLGFTKLQEMKPTVKGSRGGWGWPQWTGPRRRAFEAYCTRNDLDPTSDEANYAYLFLEMKGSERKAVDRTRKAQGLFAKVKAFELGFLRAGIKHYDLRNEWAMRAKQVYQAAGTPTGGTPAAEQIVILTDESKAAKGRGNVAAGTAAASGAGGGTPAVVAASNAHSLVDWLLLGGFGVLVIGLVVFFIVRAQREHGTASSLKAAALSVGLGHVIKGSK